MFLCVLPAILLSASVTLAAPGPNVRRDIAFAADPSINAKGIFNKAKAAQGDLLAIFPSSRNSGNNVKVFGDWQSLAGVSAIHYIADMDVDCDGVDFKCPHNPDGQAESSFGHLAATKVPFYVLPLQFHTDHSSIIKPNSLGAIVCNGRMFYGIFGDEDSDSPQMIGEASILMARTCFHDQGLDGGTGHSQLDVLYVVFGNDVPPGVDQETIDIHALKTLGDQQARRLASALGV